MKTLLSIFILVQLTSLHADNYSLSFDGSDDYVIVPDNDALDIGTSDFSIQIWLKSNDENRALILSKSGGATDDTWYLVHMKSDGMIEYEITDGYSTSGDYSIATGSVAVNDNEWHHICVVFDRDNLGYIYVDGTLDVSGSISSHNGDISNNESLEIGVDLEHITQYTDGKLDEIAIWNNALSSNEITALYNSGLGLSAASNSGDYASASNLQAYWKFNEGTGTTLADQTSNDNDGTISGATWSTDVPPTSGGNNALSFDGTDDYVSITNNIAGTYTGFTISSWVKVDDYGDNNMDFILDVGSSGDGRRIALGISSSGFQGILAGVATDVFVVNASSSNTSEWLNVVLSWSGTDFARIYINGSQSGETTSISSGTLTIESGDPFHIGKRYTGANYFPGDIDEVAIWNEALTAAEVTALYNSGTSLIPSSNSGNYTSSSNLQAYWNFNEGTGTTLADQTSNDNDGTITGASWTGDGVPVTAATTPTNTYSLNFDGSDDYVTVPYSSALNSFTDAITVTSWFKVTGNIGSQQTLIENGDTKGFVLGVTTNSGLLSLNPHLATSSGWFNLQYSIEGGLEYHTWYQAAFSYDGEVFKCYVDGVEVSPNYSSPSVSGNIDNNDESLNFGYDANWQNYFNGNIDETYIWNIVLTESQIQSYMSTPPTGSESGLVGYWKFNEGSGTTASDVTSNSNDGTISGATWSTDVPFTGATTTSALTWSVRAKASLSTYNDNDNYLGVASSATNVFDASYDALEPPAAPGSSISLYFPHAEWDYLLGDNFSTDARPEVALTDTMQVWDFVVKSTDAGEATLTFVYASVPSVPVILENTATGVRQTLSNNATYTFTAVADSAHPFRVSIGDTTAPTLTLGASCSGPAILISDSTHTLSWTSTDGFEVDSVLVSFSSDSGTTYSLQASLGTASSYNWTVPDAMVMTGGKLKLKAQDYAGNSKEEVSSYVFAIAGDSLSSAVTAGWTLWGVPINPTNDTMTTNLADDFSGYWDTFDYVDNGYTYNGILKEAEGYWLGADQNATIDVKGTPVDSNFTVSLSQGWELISNPLVLDVNVDSLTFTKNDTTKTHAEAVTAGWVNSIYSYSSSGYVSATTFSPWSGYWMAVLETGVEITYPIHRNGGSRSSRSIENEWMISFDAQVDGGNDGITRIGYAETATDGFDTEHDAVKPPNPPGPEYVSLFIAHPEWNYLLGDKFAKDIRAAVPANGYQEWQLTMESSESDAQLSWTLVNIPDDYEVGYSIDGGQYFDNMRDVSTITISANTEITVRVGSQVLGIGDEPIPTVFALHQNYPNPFNPVTTLRYDLPENGIVTIIIYDMLGRQVKTLINQTQDAGFKSVVWNATNDYGKPVSAGIYLYQIQAGENISTKKMVLLK